MALCQASLLWKRSICQNVWITCVGGQGLKLFCRTREVPKYDFCKKTDAVIWPVSACSSLVTCLSITYHILTLKIVCGWETGACDRWHPPMLCIVIWLYCNKFSVTDTWHDQQVSKGLWQSFMLLWPNTSSRVRQKICVIYQISLGLWTLDFIRF